MEQGKIWSLFARKLAGEASFNELTQLQQLKKENPQLGLYLQILTNLWNQQPVVNRNKIEQALNDVAKRAVLNERGITKKTAGDLVEHYQPESVSLN